MNSHQKKFRLIINLLFFVLINYQLIANDDLEEKAPIWETHTISQSFCGDGSPYQIFIRRGDPEKFVFEFQGGGACWDYRSCTEGFYTDLSFHTRPKKYAIQSHNPNVSPLSSHTYIYFPYCTGDVFIGAHKKDYLQEFDDLSPEIELGEKSVLHYGKVNIFNSFEYLQRDLDIDLSNSREIVSYGGSAGAIGALFHTETIDQLAGESTRKILISDSPGLHFANTFWERFSVEQIEDFIEIFDRVGLKFNYKSGMVIHQINKFCKRYSGWKMGFLQGTKDTVMSLGFGGKLPIFHKMSVLSKKGVHESLLDPRDNCAAWVPDSRVHVYATDSHDMKIETSDGVSAMDFVRQLVQSKARTLAGVSHR
jgi:hypothetical protein